MKRLLFYITLLISCLLVNMGLCQVKNAQKEISLFNYSKAITILQKTIARGEKNPDSQAVALLAECYRKQNDIPNAKIWYKKLIESDHKNPTDYFYYGQILRSSGDYFEAKKMFLKYDSLAPQDRRGRTYSGYCDSAISWISVTPVFEIKNVPALNTPQSEFGVIFFENGILFTSDRITRRNEEKLYGWTGNNYLRLFYAEPEIPDSFSLAFRSPGPAEGFINLDGHDGPASYNKVSGELFINRTFLSKDKGRKESDRIRTHLLKIYISTGQDGKWSKPEPFFLNNEAYSVGHPVISNDGKTLYFVSDMPGGYGGTDIYLCHRETGTWSRPENLGIAVNSEGNEMFPYLSENGDLYFTSDGHPGFGGLDLFLTKKINGTWTRPQNLGFPINSSYDDFSITLRENDRSGYFSSNRPGGSGNDDIYFFLRTPLPPPPSKPSPSFVTGCVKEKSTLIPVDNAFVFILEEKTGQVLILKTDKSGCFRAPVKPANSYLVKANLTGYIPDCLSFSFDISDQQAELFLPRDLLLDKLEIDKTYLLTNIYYNFDRWNIRQDAEPSLNELVKIMKENKVNIELSSHTDCRGSALYNQVLSQKRAESAVQYIVLQGIDSQRIVARGYGESKLINKCNCDKEVLCTEAEHQQNRRTEFRIISFSDEKMVHDFDFIPFHSGESIDIRRLPDGFFQKCK